MLRSSGSMTSPTTRDGFRARNIVINFFGQIIPLIVGVAAIPFVIRGLGVESFGILSIAWMLLGYFTIFDLGLGRATTKFIAEELRKGAIDGLRSIFWTSCRMNLLLGFIGGFIIAGIASFLAENVFRISPGLINATRTSFFILAASCPIVLVSIAFRGALEAAERFDYVNAVSAISSSLNFLLPMVGLLIGLDIQGIILLLMISRLCSALAYLLLCFRVFPFLRGSISINFIQIRRLLKYGGWVSVSNVINPVITYLDRFLIGSLISIAAVTYYAAPYEIVTRLSILAMSITMTLFPSFSAVNVAERNSLSGLYSRSIKLLIVFMAPLVAILVIFAKNILLLWLGFEFAEKSTVVFQILAIGILMNSLAQIPYALIQGFGHPDITAKFHLIELLLYIPLAWFLVWKLGIVGGALAWTIRVTLDSLLLFAASIKFISLDILLDNGFKRCISLISLTVCVLFGLHLLGGTILFKIIISGGVLILFAIAVWYYALDVRERELFSTTTQQFIGLIVGTK
jgi:O-antigen/teichoic acid export membrane protein